MLLSRVISAGLFFVLFFLGLFHPWFGWALPVLFAIGTVAGVHEFTHLGVHRPSRPYLAVTMLAALGLIADAYFASLDHFLLILGTLTVVTVAMGLFLRNQDGPELAGKCVMSLVYIVMPLALIMDLWRQSTTADPSSGPHYLIFLILATWSSDIGAYFTGRAIGRHKLAPKLSPGKTVEGLIGGVVFTLIVVSAMHLFWNNIREIFSWGEVLGLGFSFSLLGPLGDLAESQLKRGAGAKDSGRTGTGHGGMLDIIDSLLFTTVFYYGYLVIFRPDLLL